MAQVVDASQAFAHPVTVGIVATIALGLIVASVLIRALKWAEKIGESTFQELIARTRSWVFLSVAMVVPILLGHAWVVGFFFLLSLFCFREYARATKLNDSPTEMASVVVAICVTFFAALDHWMGLFTTSWAGGICLIPMIALLPDQPQGYLRRVALAIVGFALLGISLGHLAYLSNDPLFRPILLWLLFVTELNDVFAYLAGKAFGSRKLLPHTSPNKTWAGAIGAVVLTTTLVSGVGHFVFLGTSLESWTHLLVLGFLISTLGQSGDLVISSIKRDIGIKDMATTLPGHGGLLDRFDSLLLVAPVVFHYLNYFLEEGIGGSESVRVLTGG